MKLGPETQKDQGTMTQSIKNLDSENVTIFYGVTAQSFPLRMFSVNMTKSAISRELGHAYSKNP